MKQWIFILFISGNFCLTAQVDTITDSIQPEIVLTSNNWETKADSIIETAKSQLGTPYIWATSSPNISFDCSGFTSYVYTSNEIKSSRSSKLYANLGKAISLDEARKGDCILFSGTQSGSKTIGHVGIIVENNEDGIQFIHCSSSSKHFGVVITNYYESGYPKRFLEVRRMF